MVPNVAPYTDNSCFGILRWKRSTTHCISSSHHSSTKWEISLPQFFYTVTLRIWIKLMNKKQNC